jgi:hypothetical protein
MAGLRHKRGRGGGRASPPIPFQVVCPSPPSPLPLFFLLGIHHGERTNEGRYHDITLLSYTHTHTHKRPDPNTPLPNTFPGSYFVLLTHNKQKRQICPPPPALPPPDRTTGNAVPRSLRAAADISPGGRRVYSGIAPWENPPPCPFPP